MLRSSLRHLEGVLVAERAEHSISNLCEGLAARWEHAIETRGHPPEPHHFIAEIARQGFYLPTLTSAMGYLSTCQLQHKTPDDKTLYQLLLPWSRYLGYP